MKGAGTTGLKDTESGKFKPPCPPSPNGTTGRTAQSALIFAGCYSETRTPKVRTALYSKVSQESTSQ